MDTPPTISTERTLLRPFQPKDVEDRRRCGRDPMIMRLFGGSPAFDTVKPMTDEQARAWYERAVAEEPLATHWAVEYGGRFIGTARLHALSVPNRSARYAVGLLGRNVLGIGLGTEITRAVVRHGFEQLGLHRISLRVLATNTRAISCYRRCGFVPEGRERQSALVDGQWEDDVIMGILESDNN